VIDFITRANTWLNGIVWGPPMLILLMGTGLLLTIITGAIQFRHVGTAMREVLGKLRQSPEAGSGNVRPFAAVATALGFSGVLVEIYRERESSGGFRYVLLETASGTGNQILRFSSKDRELVYAALAREIGSSLQ
jgi:hypothetical protein